MREDTSSSRWLQIRSKKHPHWSILTLDDLDKTSLKNRQLIAQLRARYQAAKELGDDKPRQKSEDSSI